MITRQHGWWEGLDKLKLGFDILGALNSFDFNIHILTKGPSRKEGAWAEKVRWVRDNIDIPVKVTITEDKGLVYGRVLVDDFPDYIERWLEWRPRGLVIMPDRPSANKDFTHPNVFRYTGYNNKDMRKKLLEVRLREDAK